MSNLNILDFLKKWKNLLILFLGLLFIVVILFLIIKLLFTTSVVSPTPPNFNTGNQNNSIVVTSVSPQNNQTNIMPGEIIISFTTNKPISSSNDFSMSISPKFPYYWKFTNSYPTTKIEAQVYGGLNKNTKYQVSVKDSHGNQLTNWSFTTGEQKVVSDPLIIYDRGQTFLNNKFPLYKYLPYSNSDFDIDYTGPNDNTLKVFVKNPDVNLVRKEVADWIKSKNVNPATQKINYVQDF